MATGGRIAARGIRRCGFQQAGGAGPVYGSEACSYAMTQPILKRTSASRPSGEWNDDDYDVLADGAVVGRIMKVHAAPAERRGCGRWPFGITEGRAPTHGDAATRETAMIC